jgi:hypothetical protein
MVLVAEAFPIYNVLSPPVTFESGSAGRSERLKMRVSMHLQIGIDYLRCPEKIYATTLSRNRFPYTSR